MKENDFPEPQWISIDKPPPDNKKILLGKYHDDEFKLTDKPSYQNPTHWTERLSPPTNKGIK